MPRSVSTEPTRFRLTLDGGDRFGGDHWFHCGLHRRGCRFRLWFRLRIESRSEYRRQSLLTLGNPRGIMFPDDLLCIAQQLRHVAHGHAGALQKNSCESMPETVRRRLVFPRAAQIPEFIQLAPPQIGDDVHIRRAVLPENVRACFQSAGANAFLQPFGNPCVNVGVRLGGPELDRAVGPHAVHMERAHI